MKPQQVIGSLFAVGLFIFLLFARAPAFAEDIAYIGDSQSAGSGNLFSTLQPTLESKGKIVSTRAVRRATINDYLSTSSVAGRSAYSGITYLDMKEGKPNFFAGSGYTDNINTLSEKADTVVVQLGDNHLLNPKSASAGAMALAKAISGKKCIWIGPASVSASIHCEIKRENGTTKTVDRNCSKFAAKKKAVSEALKQALAKTSCTYIDSYEATENAPPESCDCLHYKPGATGYGRWANAIKARLLTAL